MIRYFFFKASRIQVSRVSNKQQRPWLILNRSRGLIYCGSVPMMKSVTFLLLFLFLQWCDCKVLRVIPPTQAEIDADVEAEREEQLKEEKEKQVRSLNQKMLW